MKIPFCFSVFACWSLLLPAQAGRYPASGVQTFTAPSSNVSLGDGTVLDSSFPGTYARYINGGLQLANRSSSGNQSVWRIPNLDAGQAIQSLDVSFLLSMLKPTTASSAPGSGFAVCFGPIPSSGLGSGDLGYTMAGGLVVSFDTYSDTPNDAPSIQVVANNVAIGNFLAANLNPLPAVTGGTFTLTNPNSGGTTTAQAYTVNASSLQTAMRAVAGWGTVTVTGSVGSFSINQGAVGNFLDPVGNGANLTGTGIAAGTAGITVLNTTDGGAAQNEIWSLAFNPAPGITGGTFTLTNPATGGVTSTLSYASSASALQSALRTVSGWGSVTVTGTPGSWVVNRGVVGSYDNPVGIGTALTGPTMAIGMGSVVVTPVQEGTASLNEIWRISMGTAGFVFDPTFRPLAIHWDYDGLDLTYGGQAIFTNLPTPGFAPASGHSVALTASATGGAQDTLLDDFLVVTSPAAPPDTGGPIISEFMAENATILEDEEMDSPDWIEIYNGQNASVNLSGYKLTNGTVTWTFPSVPMAAYGHLVVYASGKNRTTNNALLHTNFTLPKTGGTFSLLNPANAVISTWTYPNQIEDVSYGLKYQGLGTGFLDPVSPGAATLYSYRVAPSGPAEDVVWSRDGGIITGSTTLSATGAAGGVVRYTTDNSVPSEASPVFPASLTFSTTTNLRARVFRPGYLPGPVTSRTFLHVDASLSNYNGSGQPFQSHLPLVVLDSFGANVDAITDQSQPRPHRFTYGVVIDKAASGWASLTAPTYDFQGRGGTHVRGDSSGGFAQKSYAWETWNNKDEDKDVSILGMPAESDWALHGPFTDKTFFRNFIAYSTLRQAHGEVDGHAMRTRLVEVIYNQDPGQSVTYNDYRGVYVLMERIKRSKNRVDIARLNSLATDPALITGGYIFRRDRTSADGNTPLPVGMHSHTPNLLNTAQTTWLTNHLNAFNNALNGPNFADPVLGYAPYIDVDSFIDNWWWVEICKQIDGYRLSTYFYKDRVGKIFAAPIWDYNLSLGNADYLAGDQFAGWYWNQTDTYWWARLRQDPNYEIRNWDRYWELRRSVFNTASISSYIDTLKNMALNNSATAVTNNMSLAASQPATQENAAMRHYRKFQVLGTYLWPNAGGAPAATATLNPRPWQVNTTYQSEVDWMKTWLANRLNWIDDQNFSGSVVYRPPNLSHPGGNVASGTTLTISRYTGTAPAGYSYATGGTLYYTTDGSDPRSPAASGPETVLVSGSANACKWLVPSAGNGGFSLTAGSGAQQWTNLADPPNIANWTSSVTGLGYERDPASGTSYASLIGAGSNTETQMYAINGTAYMRVNFTVADAAALANIGSLKLSLKYDDGFRAYLNGVLVAGRNDTDPSLASNPATAVANQIHDDPLALVYEDIDITADGLAALRVGTNVLAFHVMNAPATSSDLLLVPRLTAGAAGAGGGSGGIAYTGPITLSSSRTINARLFANGVWSPMNTAQFIVGAAPATASNLVISEIMYNPRGASPAESLAGFGDNDFEYVEILNVGPGAVDLTPCKFTLGITFDFSVADPDLRTLPAGGRIIVVGHRDGFALRYGNNPQIRIAGVYAGSLANEGETLVLRGAGDAIIAQVTYGISEPWPVASAGEGYSLLLNNPTGSPTYGDGMNWRSSGQIDGNPGLAPGPGFVGSPSGDTDKDGLTDFIEFAMGTDKTKGDSNQEIVGGFLNYEVEGTPGDYLHIRFPRNLAADGVNYIAECSSDLINWNVPLTYVGTTHNGDGRAMVEYRTTDPIDAPTNRRLSLRLRVVAP